MILTDPKSKAKSVQLSRVNPEMKKYYEQAMTRGGVFGGFMPVGQDPALETKIIQIQHKDGSYCKISQSTVDGLKEEGWKGLEDIPAECVV